MSYRYFYRVDSKGDPIPGSNIKSTKKLNSHYREIIPMKVLCCTGDEIPTAYGKSIRYFVRLNEDRTPITGSLRKFRSKPNWGDFQEVIGDYCCTPISIDLIPVTANLTVGDDITYQVLATYKSGRIQDVTTSTIFVSGTPSVATILENVLSGVSAGSTVVTGTYLTLTDTSNVTVGTAPGISVQPSNQSVTAPATATFTVTATGTGTKTYQWYKNNVLIPSATASSYTTPATVIGDNGAVFKVIITSNFGTITSNNATLTVS